MKRSNKQHDVNCLLFLHFLKNVQLRLHGNYITIFVDTMFSTLDLLVPVKVLVNLVQM